MKSIEEIAQELSQNRELQSQDNQTASDKRSFYSGIADLMTNLGDYIVSELKHDNKVEVTNHPEEQNVKVTNFRGIFGLLESISKSVKSFKLPDIFHIKGNVTVDNFPKIEIPKVEIPEYPTSIDANVDFSNVLKKLDELKKTLSQIELNPQIDVKTEAPQVQIDLESVKSGLETIVETIKNLPQPEKTDFSEILKEISFVGEQIQETINNIKFPIPNFQSSWQHSLEMQSKDQPVQYFYTTVSNKKVIDYMLMTGINGATYKKQFTYDIDGTTDMKTKSAWIKQ